MEALDRGMRNWRLLSILLGTLLAVTYRQKIVNWMDTGVGWVNTVAEAKAEPLPR
jgi:hypothetical protein